MYNERMQDNIWYIDNKTNNHMYGDKDKFMKIDESIRDNLTFMDYSKVTIKKKMVINTNVEFNEERSWY